MSAQVLLVFRWYGLDGRVDDSRGVIERTVSEESRADVVAELNATGWELEYAKRVAS
jgi:hypothetical protein